MQAPEDLPDPFLWGSSPFVADAARIYAFLQANCGEYGAIVSGTVGSPPASCLPAPVMTCNIVMTEIAWLARTISATQQVCSAFAQDLDDALVGVEQPVDIKSKTETILINSLLVSSEFLGVEAMFRDPDNSSPSSMLITDNLRLLCAQDADNVEWPANGWAKSLMHPDLMHLYPLLMKSHGLVFLHSSDIGRTLILKCIEFLAGPHVQPALSVMGSEFQSWARAYVAAKHLGRKYNLLHQEPIFQLQRLRAWAAYSACMLAALLAADSLLLTPVKTNRGLINELLGSPRYNPPADRFKEATCLLLSEYEAWLKSEESQPGPSQPGNSTPNLLPLTTTAVEKNPGSTQRHADPTRVIDLEPDLTKRLADPTRVSNTDPTQRLADPTRVSNPEPHVDASRDRSDGLKFLSGQMNKADSQYNIPAAKASEIRWVAWFDKITNLHVLYPGLPARLTIPQLIGSLADDDHRIFGWNEYSQTLETISIEEFVGYVRKRVIPSGNVRRKALKELSELHLHLQSVPDCSALKTKIILLIARIHSVNSDEPEPQTTLQTCLDVHRLLMGARSGRHNIATEWQVFEVYRPTDMFEKYLDSDLHTPNQDDALLQEFLSHMFDLLERAHRMRVQTRDPRDSASHSERGIPHSERDRQVAAAKLLGVSQSVLAGWQQRGSPGAGRHAQKRAYAGPSGSPSKRVAFGTARGRGGRGPGRGFVPQGRSPHTPTGVVPVAGDQLTPSYTRALQSLQRDPADSHTPSTRFEKIREAHQLPPISANEAWKRWRAGACLYCAEPSSSGLPHGYRDCPLGLSEGRHRTPYVSWKRFLRQHIFRDQ